MSRPFRAPFGADALLAASAVLSISAVAAALVSQYAFDMRPCPWCVLQRAIFIALAASAVVGLAWRSTLGRRVGASLALGFSACGIAAALWQHFVAASSTSCNQSFADVVIGTLGLDSLSPELFAPRASCADAKADLMGIPYEFFSLALFAVMAIAAVRIVRSGK
jgi:disulfide bond formation protein DsbB